MRGKERPRPEPIDVPIREMLGRIPRNLINTLLNLLASVRMQLSLPKNCTVNPHGLDLAVTRCGNMLQNGSFGIIQFLKLAPRAGNQIGAFGIRQHVVNEVDGRQSGGRCNILKEGSIPAGIKPHPFRHAVIGQILHFLLRHSLHYSRRGQNVATSTTNHDDRDINRFGIFLLLVVFRFHAVNKVRMVLVGIDDHQRRRA
mmetsp:Transcript_1535/g.3661  ORF Transcript_1535/g.3661 Transcript_1535/m.3661 type:complete len:200 (-) Transcript_1535:646-1245(-)